MSAVEIALAEFLSFGQVVTGVFGNQPEIVRHAGLQVQHADGCMTLRMKEPVQEEKSLPDGCLVTIETRDEFYPLYLTRYVRSWNDCAAVETWCEIRHEEDGPVRLLRADSIATPVTYPAKTVKVLSLTGAWAYEANVVESPVGNGQVVELASKSGTRDAWESNAAMMLSFGDDVTEGRGSVLGVALAWTGTTRRRIRRDWKGSTTEVFAGVDMTTGPYVLDVGRTFVTPKAVLVWSEKGRGEVSRQYHRWARLHCLPHGREAHPVLLNSWEGSYFSFTEKTLTDMMDGVKELGGEMFVLDDGWFGTGKYARDAENRDTVGLGDWSANPERLPHGLGWLAAEANRRGLAFGLWVEPEMVNTKSWLAEAHPDWLLREANRSLVLGRGGSQTVLDFTNPAVRDHLFASLDRTYAEMPTLAYVKWDCNQNISNPGSVYLPCDRQANLWYDYTVGLYELLGRLQAVRPNVMVQACASGGGHMDYGFLKYADEFWTSDDTDAYQRVFIQWGASQFYPACAMACHVTDVPNHQTKRVTPLKYRFDVAMTGRLGFELHPRKLTAGEVAFAKRAVATYKELRSVIQHGDLYRLASPYENPYSALQYVNGDRSQSAVFVLGLEDAAPKLVSLAFEGLRSDALYEVREVNQADRPHVKSDRQRFSGDTLMNQGLTIRLTGAYDSAALRLDEVNAAVRR